MSGVSGQCSWEDSSDLYDGEEDKENRFHRRDDRRRSSGLSTDSDIKPHLSPTGWRLFFCLFNHLIHHKKRVCSVSTPTFSVVCRKGADQVDFEERFVLQQ